LVHQLIHPADRILGRLQHVVDECWIGPMPLRVSKQQRELRADCLEIVDNEGRQLIHGPKLFGRR
jgi:hypothetical protein